MGEKFVTVHPIGSDSLIILRQLYLRLRALSSTEFQKVAEELVTSWVVVVGRLLELIWEGVKTMDYRSAREHRETGTCIFHHPLPSQLSLLSLSAAMRRD
jgi:hypothetical protein